MDTILIDREYTLRTMNTWIYLAIIPSILVLLFGGLWLSAAVGQIPPGLGFLWVLICAALGFFLIKKVSIKTIYVTLTSEKLSIRSSPSVNERHILLDDIASFQYHQLNNNKTFHLRLRSGQKVKFGHSGTFSVADDMPALVAAFKKQIAARVSADQNNQRPVIRREKSLFEKPVASVFGWIIAASLVGLTIHLFLNGMNGKWAPVCMIYGNGITYLGAIYNARKGAQYR